jgi:hypothetical protein
MVTSSTLSMRCDRLATERPRALEGALPFAHGGHEDRAEPRWRGCSEAEIELFQGLPGPEHFLEAIHGPAGAPEQQGLVDDDGPAPDRGGNQPDHHQLDDDMSLPKEAPERHVVRDLRGVGRIHSHCPRLIGPRSRPDKPLWPVYDGFGATLVVRRLNLSKIRVTTG